MHAKLRRILQGVLFVFSVALSFRTEFKIFAVFCGKNVILAAQERLSSLALIKIHCTV